MCVGGGGACAYMCVCVCMYDVCARARAVCGRVRVCE